MKRISNWYFAETIYNSDKKYYVCRYKYKNNHIVYCEFIGNSEHKWIYSISKIQQYLKVTKLLNNQKMINQLNNNAQQNIPFLTIDTG